MIGRGAPRALGISGSRGRDAAPGALVLTTLWRSARRGRGHKCRLVPGVPSPPLPKPLQSLGSAPRPQHAALTSAESTRTCTRGVEPGAQGHPSHCHVCPGHGAAPGSVAIAAPSPADGGPGRRTAWTQRKPTWQESSSLGVEPRVSTAGSSCPLGPPACEKGSKQTKTPLCVN